MENTLSIHGEGIPLIVKKRDFIGCLLIYGLTHLENNVVRAAATMEFISASGEYTW